MQQVEVSCSSSTVPAAAQYLHHYVAAATQDTFVCVYLAGLNQRAVPCRIAALFDRGTPTLANR